MLNLFKSKEIACFFKVLSDWLICFLGLKGLQTGLLPRLNSPYRHGNNYRDFRIVFANDEVVNTGGRELCERSLSAFKSYVVANDNKRGSVDKG